MNSRRDSAQLAAHFKSCKADILTNWELRVRSSLAFGKEVDGPSLLDSMPRFFDALLEVLSEPLPLAEADSKARVAQIHGSQRALELGFGIEQVIREYGILRELITETARLSTPAPSETQLKATHAFIDHGIAHAAIGYADAYRSKLRSLAHEIQRLDTHAREICI